MARLRPFFKYFGSKHRLAPKYPRPLHGQIVEPFAGSASYATLHHTASVFLCEIDPDIFQLWRWLIATDAAAVRALPFDLPVGLDLRDIDAPYGGQLLIRTWQRVGRNNCWTVSKWNNTNSGLWCESSRDAIAAQLPAIRHWQVFHGSILSQLDSLAPATWFVDPPYQSQPNVYGCPALDYEYLGRWCASLPGQVIVCEAPGADWLPFRRLASNTVGRTCQGGTRAKRDELIWTNCCCIPPLERLD